MEINMKKLSELSHPIQPVGLDEHGVLRFKKNAIVAYLLENGPIDMNQIALQGFSPKDREQFAQLIGYSVDGAADLSYVRRETITAADLMAKGVDEKAARIKALETRLEATQDAIVAAVSALGDIELEV